MDPHASQSLDDDVVAMMEEENGPPDPPPPPPDPAPAPAAGETPAATPPEPPAAQPPAAEAGETPAATPAVEPPAPPAAAAPPVAPDLSTVSPEIAQAIQDKFVSEMSKGVFKTAADLETAKGFEVLASVPLLTEQLQTLKANEVVLANPLMKSLNDYQAQGGENVELFLQLQKLNVAEMTPEEVIKTEMLMSEMGLTSAEIDAHIIDTYHRYDEEHENYDAATAARGGRQMKIDAATGRTKLTGMQSDIKPLDAEAQQKLTTDAANLKAQEWEPIISSSVEKFLEIEFPMGEKGSFKYAVTDESKAESIADLREMIESTGAKFDHEGVELARELLYNKYIVNNIQDIAKAIGIHARSLNDEEWMAENHNPSAIAAPAPPAAAPEEDVVETILNFENQEQQPNV